MVAQAFYAHLFSAPIANTHKTAIAEATSGNSSTSIIALLFM
jgi:hypothetical protein